MERIRRKDRRVRGRSRHLPSVVPKKELAQLAVESEDRGAPGTAGRRSGSEYRDDQQGDEDQQVRTSRSFVT